MISSFLKFKIFEVFFQATENNAGSANISTKLAHFRFYSLLFVWF